MAMSIILHISANCLLPCQPKQLQPLLYSEGHQQVVQMVANCLIFVGFEVATKGTQLF